MAQRTVGDFMREPDIKLFVRVETYNLDEKRLRADISVQQRLSWL